MKRMSARAIARRDNPDRQNFVAWWATTMWALAALYLLATFTPY